MIDLPWLWERWCSHLVAPAERATVAKPYRLLVGTLSRQRMMSIESATPMARLRSHHALFRWDLSNNWRFKLFDTSRRTAND